jgi:hypothetical protein
MAGVAAVAAVEVELAGAGSGWTALTADVRIGLQPVEVSYGIRSSSPLDRIATTGTMTWALNNSNPAGYYSPGHTNARSGFDIGIGVRLKITYDGTSYYKFRGTLISVDPTAGKTEQAVICQAVDWVDEAARTRIRGIGIQTNQRSDQIIDTIVTNSVTRQPASKSLATGQSTFAIALDNMEDTQTPVLTALNDVTVSELGYLYVKGDTSTGGVLTFQDRHARSKSSTVGSFDETMAALDVRRDRADIANRVYVVVHPRTTAGSASVLWELTTTDSVPSIPAGETIQITAPFRESTSDARSYRVAGTSVVTPVAGTDWIANTAEDGSGSVITSDVAVTLATTAANAVTFNIVNNGTVTAYLTTIQIRGTQVSDVSETVMAAADSTSQTTYGEVDVRVDMKYESRTGSFAFNIAEWLLGVLKDPRFVVNRLTIQGNKSAALMVHALARDIGDRITVAESFTGLTTSTGYFINGVDVTVGPASTITTSWILAPADQSAFWILGQAGASELDISTVLGFA